MANIKMAKVMEKLNSQKSSKESAAPTKLPIPQKKRLAPKAPEPEEEDMEEFEDEEAEDQEDQESANDQSETEQEVTEGHDQAEVINREIERLHNDGVFRAELLYQLIEINTHLKVLNALIMKAVGEEKAEK